MAKRYEVDEMFNPECVGCLMDLFHLGWDPGPSIPSSLPPE